MIAARLGLVCAWFGEFAFGLVEGFLRLCRGLTDELYMRVVKCKFVWDGGFKSVSFGMVEMVDLISVGGDGRPGSMPIYRVFVGGDWSGRSR